MRQVSVEEARKSLGDLVTDIANGGEPAVITKNGIIAAVVQPVKPSQEKLSISLKLPRELVEDEQAFLSYVTHAATHARNEALAKGQAAQELTSAGDPADATDSEFMDR